MSRLVTFGCSNTYGSGFDKVDNGPSNLAWPNVLATHIEKECLNLSKPGASFKEIWHRISTTEFKKDDTVIIMWSYFFRSCDISNNNDVEQLFWYKSPIVSKKNTVWKKHFITRSENDLSLEFWLYADHADKIIKSKKVNEVKHFVCSNWPMGRYPRPEWSKNIDIDLTEWKWNDYAEDKIHPSINEHYEKAMSIKKCLK